MRHQTEIAGILPIPRTAEQCREPVWTLMVVALWCGQQQPLPPQPSVSGNELPAPRANLTKTNKYTPPKRSPAKRGGCCVY